jgi:hypothetical protein
MALATPSMHTEGVPAFIPELQVQEVGGRVRLSVRGLGHGDGATLQEAGDELVQKMLAMALSFRAGGVGRVYSGCLPDLQVLDFVWRLGEVAAAGGDIRDHLFGPSSLVG